MCWVGVVYSSDQRNMHHVCYHNYIHCLFFFLLQAEATHHEVSQCCVYVYGVLYCRHVVGMMLCRGKLSHMFII